MALYRLIISFCGIMMIASIGFQAASNSYMSGHIFQVDRDGLMINSGRMGVGTQTPVVPFEVSGNARFRGAISSTPVITTNIAIDWTTSPYQFLTITSAATTQNITFVNPQRPSSLLLVIKRNIGIVLPTIAWKGGANIVFPRPVGGVDQYDVIGFLFDGTNYIGVPNQNFRVPVVNPFGS